MIPVTAHITLLEGELSYSAVRASGPGGQHVNTTASAVQLQFDAKSSPAITPAVFTRLKRAAGSRMSEAGVITLKASSERSQHRNREIVTERLVAMIRTAATPPKARRKTRPSKASKERRLTAKARTATIKRSRGRVRGDD